MENIDNWEVVSDEQMGAYLSDKRDSINISSFDDGVDARYSYETEVEKKDYRNYFGKIRHNYQDIKRNPLTTFARNTWNGLLDLPKGLGDAFIGAGEYVAFKSVGGIDPEFDKRLAEGANALRAKNDEWFRQYQYINNQQDNTFVADLGRAGGSLIGALGLSFMTRNPTAVAGAFGASQFGSINKELRERGVDIDRSMAISTGLGLAEGVLEKIGLHLWFENAATKKISTYLIKQGATEFTQEASQTAVEEVSMKLLGERDTEWFDIVKGVIYSGVIGGITGIGGGAVSIPSTEAFKKQAKEKLVEKGFTEEKAQQLVDDAAYSNEEARRDLLELVNKEADQSTLLNGSYEDDVKAFAEVTQQNVVAEAFDIKQTLKETAMKEGGLDEETAEVASTLVENFTKVMYNEIGQTPLEQFEDKGLTIIDERYPSPQDEVIDESELTEEEIARLEEAEAQRQEFDIPFQTDQLRPGDRPYSNKQLERLLENPQGNKEAIIDVYNNHLAKYNDVLATRVRATAMYDFGLPEKLTSGELYKRKQEEKEQSLKSLKLPKKITLNYLKNILKKNNIKVVREYTANTGSQYLTLDLEDTPFENVFNDGLVVLSIRDHYKHSNDFVRSDIDFMVDYDNQWIDALVELADKLDLKGAEVTKARKYIEIRDSDNIYYQEDDFDGLKSSKSVSDVKKLLKTLKSDEEIRIMYDANKGYWFAVDSNDYIHNEMLEKAFEQGLYSEFRSVYDAQQYFDENYNAEEEYLSRFKAIGFNNAQDMESILKENLGVDEYDYGYSIKDGDKGYILFARSLYDLSATPLKSIGKEADIWKLNEENRNELEKVSKEELAENDIFYQTAYHGSGESELAGGKFSLDYAGTGEGNAAHGYGVYATVNYDVADEKYREMVVNARYAKESNRFNEDILQQEYDKQERKASSSKSQVEWDKLALLEDLLVTHDDAVVYVNYPKELQEWYTKNIRDTIINRNRKRGQVYELDIPENIDLLDEQKSIYKQRAKIKKAVISAMKEVGLDKFTSVSSLGGLNGADVYDMITRKLDFNQKKTSELLYKYGVKGITYDGREDGRSFVIFNPEDIKIIQNFYQGRTVRRGSYNPTTQVIRLFKEANPSTIIHELGHFFTMKYVKALEETGQQEKLAGFYNWLGINSIDEATTETWEKMARGFETYALEGVAPNASTESVFQRMKQWLIGVYQDLKGKVIPPEEINDDVREFFDGMLATEEAPIDVSNVKGRTKELVEIINAALKGEEVSIDGLTIEDVKRLVKASNARLPRLPKNLEQAIRAAGGIDIQLAKSLGLYDEKIGKRSGFFKEGGAFEREDSLIEFLREEGFLSAPESISYEQMAEIQDRAISLLENASEVFRESDIGTIQQRESLAEAAQEASRLLQNIDYKEVQQAIKTLRDKSISAVQKDTLRYIKARLNRIDKDYRKIVDNSLRSQRKDIAQKQTDVINYIKEQPISNDHKFRLINEVKKANTDIAFEKAINEVKRRSSEYYEQEQKKLLTTQIKKEIKKSKSVRATEQRYDYETNKLFQSLREYDKLTQDAASAELEKFVGIEEPQNTDLIKIRFLNYKANGMKSSTQLMEKVLDDILQAKRLGTMLKDQADMEAKINKEELKQEVIAAVKANNANKDTFKTQFANLYRKGFANLYSMINSIASKKLAERFEMETVLNDADIAFYKHTDNLTKKVMNIFGLKSRGDLLNKFADMGEVVDTIYAENGNKYDVTKLDIVDIYNAIKNEKTRQNYLTAYGEEQVMRVVNMLNQQERLFADIMMDDINSLYPETNKIYIEAYGMDLKKVENYWPATSEHIKETDLLGDFYVQQETPSFYKERVKGHVIPMPKNAWEKYLKHVNESLYMIKVARKYKELSDTFKSSRVRNQIENKYGKGVYNELMKQINDLSLNAKSESLNYVESAFGGVLNNFVVAKIAIAPTVFAGQLTSITNYSEEVNTVEFYKNFSDGLAHPKETIKFMKKHTGDFLETRYKGGYSEALNRVQREAEQANKRKFKILSDKAKYNVTNALTSFVRVGDMGSLIFGGYAQIQTNIKAGMSLDEAIKKFEFDTLRSQQSSNAASLSSFQKSRGFSRVLLAFKNTQHQYLRKIVDSIIQYQRGEIDAKQCAKTILNYAVIQGSLYIIAKNAVKMAFGLGDDDDELTDGLLEQLIVGNLDAIPFVSDIARYAYKKAAGEYTHGLLNMPGLDDVERAIMKLYKEDKDVYDWVDIIAPLIEGTTATPVKRYAGMLKKYMEDE